MTSRLLSVRQAVGDGNPLNLRLASIIVALMITSYILIIGQVLQPTVYYFQDRSTFFDIYLKNNSTIRFLASTIVTCLIMWLGLTLEGRTRIITLTAALAISLFAYSAFSDTGLVSVAICSVPLVFTFLACSYKSKFLIQTPRELFRLMINYLFFTLIVLSSFSIVISFMGLNAMLYDPFYQILVLFSTLSPLLVFLIIMSVPINLLLEHTKFSSKVLNYIKVPHMNANLNIKLKIRVLILIIFCTISVLLVLIPQVMSGDRQNIGVDTDAYVEWISITDQSPTLADYLRQLFVEISDGDRPISLWIIHLLIVITGGIDQSIVIATGIPLLVTPILVVVTYFLCREVIEDVRASLFASFLTAIGFQVLVGLYAGLYANWIALIPSYLSLLFLLRFLKSSETVNLGFFAMCFLILLFTHVYTWTIITFFTILFLAIVFIKRTVQTKTFGVFAHNSRGFSRCGFGEKSYVGT